MTADDIGHAGLRRLYQYWLDKRGDRPMPAPRDIDPLDLRFIVGNLVLIDVGEEPSTYTVRLHGSNLAHELGVDMTGRNADSYPFPEFAKFVRDRFDRVVATRRPRREFYERFVDDRKRRLEAIVLPLSTDGHRVDRLLVGQINMD